MYFSLLIELQIQFDYDFPRVDLVKNEALGDWSFLDPRLLQDLAHPYLCAAKEI
jgi:hypothetical protein